MHNNKIYRSRTNTMIAGVCGGLAQYFNVDVTLVRILWVIGSLASSGLGVLLYLVCIAIIPEEDNIIINEVDSNGRDRNLNNLNNKTTLGLVLIALGAFFLMKRFIFWLDYRILFAVGAIVLGVYLMLKKGDN